MIQLRLSSLRLHLLPSQFPALHGLRVLGIVSVLQYHLTLVATANHLVPMRHALTWLSLRVRFGMDLFFVLSGFLIGSILMPSEGAKPPSFGRFYLRRVFRTVPSYWVVLTAVVLGYGVSAAQRANLPWEYAYLRMYVRDNDAPAVMPWGWSLLVEEHFYAFVPLVALVIRRLPRPSYRTAALVVGILSAAVVRATLRELDPHPTALHRLYFQTHTRYDTLLTGILLAQLMRDHGPSIRDTLRRPLPRAALWAVVLGCLVALMWPAPREGFFIVVLAWGTITSVMYLALISLLVAADTWLGRVLSARPWVWIATLGYGVYLVHPPATIALVHAVQPIVQAYGPWPPWLVWSALLVAVLAFALAISYVLHLFVEKPALWLRDRVAS